MISRRHILRGLITGTALGLTGFSRASTTAAPSRRDAGELFQPFRAGSPAGFGWFLESVSPAIGGAIFLGLIHDSGTTARIRVCRHDGSPMGVAHSGRLDFVLMGRKGAPTDENLGRAITAIASAAGKNDASHVVSALKTHKEHLELCRV